MKQTILIRNVLALQGNHLNRCSLFLKDGKIAEITVPDTDLAADTVIDGTNLTALPGLFDMHVHLRDPGQTHKEDILTGAAAALAGGITGVACMPNTTPAIDSVDTVRYILEKASSTGVAVHPVGCITNGLAGKTMSDFAALKEAGICAVSDDGRPVETAERMRQALIKAFALGIPVISHCEDLSIINGGIVNHGKASEMLGVKGMDRSSEDYITAREIILAASTNTAIHIAHVSTKGSVEIIRQAKAHGVSVTCETCPHYFLMTEDLVLSKDADYRMNPPLRTEEDRKAVLEGVLDGTIDCIVTDHAPHAAHEKEHPLDLAPNGITGLDTAVSLLWSLVEEGVLDERDMIRLYSHRPGEIFGIPTNSFREGDPADFFLFDPRREWVVSPETLHSKSANTPWLGRTLRGRVSAHWIGGVRVAQLQS